MSHEDAERAWLPSTLLALTIAFVLGTWHLTGRRRTSMAHPSSTHLDGADDEWPPWDEAA
ncbi:MAG: hypothetical protein R3C39_01520 [Dehalococcoidia bacterium]